MSKNAISTILKNPIFRNSVAKLVKATGRGQNFLDRSCPENYKTIVKYSQNAKLNINTNLHIEKQIFLYGYFDPEVIWFVQKYIDRSATILDIGANSGIFSIAFATHLDRQGHVYAFEPGWSAIQRFRANLAINLNLQPQITLIEYGIGKNEMSLFRKESEPRGNGTLFDSEGRLLDGGELVKIISLDSWVKSRKLQKLDFIKVDVEGFELSVFQGAMYTLNFFKPTIWFESTDIFQGEERRVSACYKLLEKLDYQIINPVSLYSQIPVYGRYPQDSLAVHRSQKNLLNLLPSHETSND